MQHINKYKNGDRDEIVICLNMKQWLIMRVMWTDGEFTVGCRWEEAFGGLRRGKQSSLAGVESTSHECSENTQHGTKKSVNTWCEDKRSEEVRRLIMSCLPGTLHRAGRVGELAHYSDPLACLPRCHDDHSSSSCILRWSIGFHIMRNKCGQIWAVCLMDGTCV